MLVISPSPAWCCWWSGGDAHPGPRPPGHPHHADTLTTRNNLAKAYRSAGRKEQAIALDEQTLTDRERILGPDHPDTLTTRNNLAMAYQLAGRLEQAIALYEQTLTDRERILGPDHPDTLTTRNNLAEAQALGGVLTQDSSGGSGSS